MDYFFHQLLDADYKEITWWATTVRGIFFFIFGILLIKIGGKRMFSSQGAFDIVISIMLGALLAKAIAGNARVIPTIISTLAMVVFHNILSRLSFYNRLMEQLVKGKPEAIIKNGHILHDKMKKHHVTENDILEILRNKKHDGNLHDIKDAHVEANGKISIILKEDAKKK